MEINCSVLGGGSRAARASVCEQPIPWEEFLSFSDKYLRGGKTSKSSGMAGQERRIPAPISAELVRPRSVQRDRRLPGDRRERGRADRLFPPRRHGGDMGDGDQYGPRFLLVLSVGAGRP